MMNIESIKNQKIANLLKFTIPSTIGMVLSTFITLTDGFFTGNYIGSAGLVAVNLGLPVLYLYLAIGLMIGVGGSVICGIENGAKNHKKANDVFNQSLVLTLLVTAGISVVLALCFNPMMKLLRVSDDIAPLFRDYYSLFLIFCPLMVMDSVFGMFLRADGKPQVYMGINILTVILNALLDYVFAARLGLGIRGIAFASLGTLALSIVLCSLYFLKPGKEKAGLKIGKFSWQKDEIARTFLNGSSEFIGELSGCISMYCYNFVLLKYSGESGVAAFTILGYSLFIFSLLDHVERCFRGIRAHKKLGKEYRSRLETFSYFVECGNELVVDNYKRFFACIYLFLHGFCRSARDASFDRFAEGERSA